MSREGKKHKIEINDRLYCEAGVMARALHTHLEAFVERAIEEALIKGKEEVDRLKNMEPLDYAKLLDEQEKARDQL